MMNVVRDGLFEAAAEKAREAGVFSTVRVEGERLVCVAKDVEEAEYRLDWDEKGTLWVSLVTPDRWLSGSIEGDLVNTGDKMGELVTDELVELGCDDTVEIVEHFRSEDLLFTFRSPVPVGERGGDEAANLAAVYVLAYEACFRQLGDMGGEGED
ncbi:MAG: hypothetical protein Q9O74_11930 [Planctomycetota bacterium]|nr:hypothetical protein [Planctomycetota bacterium]